MSLSPFGIRPGQRVAAFIDGPNLYAAAKHLNFDIDYNSLRAHLEENSDFLRAYYYTAVVEDSEEYSPLRPLLDWLDFNGFSVITKPVKEFTDETGRKRHKGSMDIEIAVDMLETAQYIDHAILFSGDGDFRRAVESLQNQGVRVTVVSTKSGQTGVIAEELRRQADRFVDLKDLGELIARPSR